MKSFVLNLTSVALLLVGAASASPVQPPNAHKLPIVDLGYVKQQATLYNETGDYYVFSNIRFAAPPLGDLRWKKPAPPLKEKEVQNGTFDRSTRCAQLNGSTPIGDEDCLVSSYRGSLVNAATNLRQFLDVYVPRQALKGKKLPVLAW